MPNALWKGLDKRLKPLILASASPRRAEILRVVGWPFEVCPVAIDESRKSSEEVISYVERLAGEKAAAGARQRAGLILGADTMVVAAHEILGKPSDPSDAVRMLQSLSGTWHEVVTGVALLSTDGTPPMVAHEITRVRFKNMSTEEIDWYVATGEPMDKAGAYAIQGRAGLFIAEIEGDYWNVVGLPIQLVYKLVGTKGSKGRSA
jgi:septum formation protein